MAMYVILHPLNELLADPASEEYAAAAAAVADATTCREAVDRLGVLQNQSARVIQEADAVFDAMPPEVDQGILGALRTGFDRRWSMALHWERPDPDEGEPTVAHRVEEQGDRLDIYVIAPDGQRFL
jgi:hypothetical protein